MVCVLFQRTIQLVRLEALVVALCVCKLNCKQRLTRNRVIPTNFGQNERVRLSISNQRVRLRTSVFVNFEPACSLVNFKPVLSFVDWHVFKDVRSKN